MESKKLSDIEIWKVIESHISPKGFYEVSNMGEVRYYTKHQQRYKYRKLTAGKDDYLQFSVNSLGKHLTFRVHQIVWDLFGDAKRNGNLLQIDHIDGNKQNNRIDNLQLLTNRENIFKFHDGKKSLPVGVTKKNSKFRAVICINGKRLHLGYFDCPLLASLAYQNTKRHYGF